jgi:hypothetical protein
MKSEDERWAERGGAIPSRPDLRHAHEADRAAYPVVVTVVVLLVWLALALAADLPAGVTASGAVAAVVFGWWERQKQRAAGGDEVEYLEEFEDEDDPFERDAPIFYV